MLVKFFNQVGKVELKEMESIKEIENKVIRIIPDNMLKFNNNIDEYINITSENIGNLSSGDTIILIDDKGSWWHELYLNEEIKELCLRGYSNRYESIKDILESKGYKRISLRNDLYIPDYAKA